MSKICNVYAREILDSRGNPTVEVEVLLESGIKGIASVPSGASTGKREALELRDNDNNRYHGKGVLKAVSNVNNIINHLIVGMAANNLREIDEVMIKRMVLLIRVIWVLMLYLEYHLRCLKQMLWRIIKNFMNT